MWFYCDLVPFSRYVQFKPLTYSLTKSHLLSSLPYFLPSFLPSIIQSFLHLLLMHSFLYNSIHTFNSCTRRNVKVTWTDTGTNGVLWEISGKAPIQIQIGRTKWRWTGHARKKHRGIVTRQALNWNPQVLYLLGPHLDHTRKISPGREELKRGNRWCLMLKEYFLG